MKKVCILTYILLSAVGCFSNLFDEIPQGIKIIAMKQSFILRSYIITEGTCYLRLKVMCQKEITLEALIGNDIFTDTVFVNSIGEGVDTYKCLPVPCHMNGELPGDVVLLGKDILTRPDHLEKGIEAFTSEDECMDDQTTHFEVECEGEENVEINEREC